MLGPILFVLHTYSISEIVSYHSLSLHSFSDNNQLYISGDLSEFPQIFFLTQSCISDVKAWMIISKLHLNKDKVEMILIAPEKLLSSGSAFQSIKLESCDIKLANTVHDLGVSLAPAVYFQQQISSLCRVCYLELRRIFAIRHYISDDVTNKLLCAFVLSRLLMMVMVMVIMAFFWPARTPGESLTTHSPPTPFFF